MSRKLADDMGKALDDARKEAWASLARYKFWMFGYYAARWVFLNRLGDFKRSNPFRSLVVIARKEAGMG